MSALPHDQERVPPKERIIVTALKSRVRVEGVYDAIEWTVQNRARVESIGSSLYTLVLMSLLDQGIELTSTHLSQGFINACFRACCASEPGGCSPKKATYAARPRLFNEQKWRSNNARDPSETALDWQLRVDTASRRCRGDRDVVIKLICFHRIDPPRAATSAGYGCSTGVCMACLVQDTTHDECGGKTLQGSVGQRLVDDDRSQTEEGASVGDQRSAPTAVVEKYRDPRYAETHLVLPAGESNEGDQRPRSSPTCHVQLTDGSAGWSVSVQQSRARCTGPRTSSEAPCWA
jgi:hypothetical protein